MRITIFVALIPDKLDPVSKTTIIVTIIALILGFEKVPFKRQSLLLLNPTVIVFPSYNCNSPFH